MGDIVIQTPLINWLKSKISNFKITFLTSKEFQALVENNDQIDSVIYYERKKGREDFNQLMGLSSQIRNEIKPDLILDLHNTLRGKVIKLFTPSIPKITINKRSLRRFLFIKFKINLFKKLETHHERIIYDLHKIFHQTYFRDDLEDFVAGGVQLNGKLSNTSAPIQLKKDNKLIVISPIASFAPKRWPIISYKKLIELILTDVDLAEYQMKIVAGPNDTYCKELNSPSITESNRVENLQGLTTLNETNEIIGQCRICITNDTGAGHISEAFGIPVLAIFGPTSEYFGFRPHLKKSRVISNEKLWCRPCSADGKKPCFRKEQYCMTEITPDSVFKELKQMLITEDSNV
jgi:ADP-heptose:LPS heptosyltransferase